MSKRSLMVTCQSRADGHQVRVRCALLKMVSKIVTPNSSTMFCYFKTMFGSNI